jgi:hypothetical protein
MKENSPIDNFGSILDDAFSTFPETELPATFTDELVRRLEVQLSWRVLLTEFGLKIALVVGTLVILLVGLLYPFKTGEKSYINYLVENWQIVSGIIAIFFFIFLVDQVFLRHLLYRSRNQSTT